MKASIIQHNKTGISPKQIMMTLPLCVVLGLSSCHSVLVDAAKRGDVAGVKQAIAAGASTFEINKAANAAYQTGNSAIIDELVKAGAIVAPENAAGLTFVLQVDKMGENSILTVDAPADLKDETSISPIVYWQPVRWYAPASDDYCRLRELKWGVGQGNSFNSEKSAPEGSYNIYQSYKRLDRSRVILFDSANLYLPKAYRWFKYELEFDTPSSGTFYGYDGQLYCNIMQLKGRFWIKKQSAEKKKSNTTFEAPSSIKGKKIVMDYSTAQSRWRNDIMPEGVWTAWRKCSYHSKTTRTFDKNNKCLNMKGGGESAYWTYKKTGTHSAELDNGIWGESGLDFPETYTMTSESATTGTIYISSGGEGQQSETTGIRFTIK